MLSYRDYIDFAERYVYQAESNEDYYVNENQFLIPAVILSWSAIESFVNNIMDDFSSLSPDLFGFHERAFLMEQRVKFQDSGNDIGKFVLEGTEYRRLEDKIFFLLSKFDIGNTKNFKGETLWHSFVEYKECRNKLVHPRRGDEIILKVDTVNSFIDTSKQIISLVSKHVWGKSVSF